jgi:ankyrin repeat protein
MKLNLVFVGILMGMASASCSDSVNSCRASLDELALSFQDLYPRQRLEEVAEVRSEISRTLRSCSDLPIDATVSANALFDRDSFALTLLDLAVYADDVELVRLYLDQGIPIEGYPQRGVHAYTGGTSLHVAAISGSLRSAEVLLQSGADPSAIDDRGNSPLTASLGFSEPGLELTQLLIDWGGDLERRNSDGLTALELAISLGDIEKVRLLLSNGADTGSRPDGTALRDFALSFNRSNIAELLP